MKKIVSMLVLVMVSLACLPLAGIAGENGLHDITYSGNCACGGQFLYADVTIMAEEKNTLTDTRVCSHGDIFTLDYEYANSMAVSYQCTNCEMGKLDTYIDKRWECRSKIIADEKRRHQQPLFALRSH